MARVLFSRVLEAGRSKAMYRRAAAFRLHSLKDRRNAASTAVPSSSTSSGFFTWLTGERSSSLPNLDKPLSGIAHVPVLPDRVEASKTEITTLPNGVKIVSETSASPGASLGLYIDCGSIYETPYNCGATYLLEKMAFKSTRNRSHLRIVREVEAIGGNVAASASREQMGYTINALETYVPQMVELLVDCVRNPVFLEWEVNEEIQKVKAGVAELSKNPQDLLLESIHSACYTGALANPLFAPESALDRLDGSILEDFVAENYTAPRMVLAASGVEHKELLSVAEPLLSDLPNVTRPIEPPSTYVGGDFRQNADCGNTHVALAFELRGGWLKERDAIILTVIQMLMGGGDLFSPGGPGKGMHSRLYLWVLDQFPQLHTFSAFNSIFNKTGLFGIYVCTSSDFVSKAVDLAAAELRALATPGLVTSKELNRAKESTKSAVLMNLEFRTIVSEDIGRQVLTFGERKTIEQYLQEVDKITLEDIMDVSQRMFSSPLTMASYGDVANVPSYESISKKFFSHRRYRRW